MENSQQSGGADHPATAAAPDSPSSTRTTDPDAGAAAPPTRRTPFTSLSQEEADRALARALQEQERAYMMLSMGGGSGLGEYDFANSDDGSYGYDHDDYDDEEYDDDEMNGGDATAVDEHHGEFEFHNDHNHDTDNQSENELYGEEDSENHEEENEEDDNDHDDDDDHDIHGADYEDDEAFARALQEVEEREVAARLMAMTGLHDWGGENHEDDAHDDTQDEWEEVDPDQLSYEELIALGEVVGTESRGLSADKIASLPSVTYKAQSVQDGDSDQCVICRLDFEDGDSLVLLSCKHIYHPECINKWLQINKVCPICNVDASTSGNRQE